MNHSKQDEPVSFDQATAENRRVLDEIEELQAWLSGRDVRAETGRRVSSVTYHRERAEKIARLQVVCARRRHLRDWIADHNRQHETTVAGGGSKLHEHEKLLVKLFHAVCELQETGAPVGPRIEAVLSEIEMALPPRILIREA